jgi:hypothetical protein
MQGEKPAAPKVIPREDAASPSATAPTAEHPASAAPVVDLLTEQKA